MTSRKIYKIWLLTCCLALLLGSPQIVAQPPAPAPSVTDALPTDVLPTDALPGEVPLPHWLQWTDQIYSGAQPHTEDDFAALQQQGIQTIVSVDGAKPNIALAKRYGMRYIHVPIGYGGIHAESELAFFRIAQEVKGTVYVHCHHGRHRGPAATAILCMGAGKIDTAEAEAQLRSAGTSPSYVGLWKAIRQYRRPSPNQALPELVEVAEVASTTAWMAQIDRTWDNLNACQQADWNPPADHPDLVAQHEALQLLEGFTEATRLLPGDAPNRLKAGLAASRDLSKKLVAALQENQSTVANQTLRQLREACVSCHKDHR